MLLSSRGFMLLLFGSLLLLSCINFVNSEPKVVHMQAERKSRGKLNKRDFGDGNSAAVGLSNNKNYYYVNTTVGTPGQTVEFDLDTGSSDTWMLSSQLANNNNSGLNIFFNSNDSSTCAMQPGSQYTFTYVDKTQVTVQSFIDDLTLGEFQLKQLQMGLAFQDTSDVSAPGLFQCIMGLGPSTSQVSRNASGHSSLTILDQMVNQSMIKSHTYSMWLNSVDSGMGNILFGGYDRAKFDGDLSIIDIQPPGDSFYVAVTGLVVSDEDGEQFDFEIDPTSFILDSGTTITTLPPPVFDSLAEYLMVDYTAAQTPQGNVVEYWTVSCDLKSRAGQLYFQFGSEDGPWIYVPFSELAMPNDELTFTDEDGNAAPGCVFGVRPNNLSDNRNFLGDTFLRSAYVLYNLDTMQVGIAQAKWDVSETDYYEVSGESGLGSVSSIAGPTISQTETVALSNFPKQAGMMSGTVSGVTKPTETPSTVAGAERTTITEIKAVSATSGSSATSSTKSAASPPAAIELSTLPVILLALCGSMMLMGAFIL